MFRLGTDFQAGRRGDTYDARTGQWWLWAVLFFVLQFFVYALAQDLVARGIFFLMNSCWPGSPITDPLTRAQLAKAAILGFLPAGAIAAMFSWWCAGRANSTGDYGIPLRWPKMGSGGWALTVGGVIVFLYLTYIVVFFILGIDPETYAPTAGGVNDPNSMSGMVEKTMADLANEPLLFAIALPGVIFGAPLAEEFIFRGALFSALRNSWFGKTGAVVLSSALWASIHSFAAPWLFVFVIFIMGLVLGVLLLRFGSLWVTIIVHSAWNAFTTLGIFGTIGGS